MRVLIATPQRFPHIGGPAAHVQLLEHSLSEYGVDCSVVSFSDVLSMPKGLRHLVFLFRLLKSARKKDIVYALDPVSVGLPATLVSLLFWKPLVVRIAGDYAWEQGMERFGIKQALISFSKGGGAYPMPVVLLRMVERVVAKRAKRVVVPSRYFARVIKHWGVLDEKIVIVKNSVSSHINTGNRNTLRELLQIKGKFVMSAGRLVPLKGFKDLILVVERLRADFPHMKLLIAGNGPCYGELEKLILKHNLEENVVLAGVLDQDVLFSYIRASDVFVLNSWHETFSHLLLEVMAIGTPVIATRVGGTPEMIEDKKEGVLIPPKKRDALEDALRALFAQPALGQKLVRGAKRKMLEFKPQSEVVALKDVFESL